MSDSNLPPNLTEDFNEGTEMKVCPVCKGEKKTPSLTNLLIDNEGNFYNKYYDCINCKGTGEAPITASDKEDEGEKKSGIYYQ